MKTMQTVKQNMTEKMTQKAQDKEIHEWQVRLSLEENSVNTLRTSK